ncbi:MAG TPA: helix-turn-helix transcriptional regulator [Sphingomonas sp.]|nr:helix-turn-helix transcriptional regulator [Sphingomonas sp.]
MMIRSADLPPDMAAVVAFEDRYRAGFVDPPHSHDRAQLSFALSGVLTVNTVDASFALPPNRAIWIPAHTTHQTICRSDVVFQALYIDPRFVRQPRRCRVFEASPLVRSLANEITTFDYRYAMEGREAAIVQLLLDEIERMPVVPLRAELPDDRRLRRVCEAILADPADTHDIDYWAKQAGMARRTFTRCFREQTGMGLATWRRQVRVMEAASRIAAGEPITSVAYDVGYDSPSAFTAMFHRTFGATPSTYCRC